MLSSSLSNNNSARCDNNSSSGLLDDNSIGDDNSDSVSVASNVSIKWETLSSADNTVVTSSSVCSSSLGGGGGGTETSYHHCNNNDYYHNSNKNEAGRRLVKKRIELDDLTVKLQRQQREEGGGKSTKLLGICLLLALLSFSTVKINHDTNRNMSVSTRLGKKTTTTRQEEEEQTIVFTEQRQQQQDEQQEQPLDERVVYQQAGEYEEAEEETMQQQQQLYNLRHLANLTSPWKETDVPYLLQIPRSGGSTVRDILSLCYGLTEATDATTTTPAAASSSSAQQSQALLEVIHSEDGTAHVNVDLSTAEGIDRAQRMGLLESDLVHYVVTKSTATSQQHHVGHRLSSSSLTSLATGLFTQDYQGRLILGLLRHPIERSVSLFHYLGVASWEENYDPTLALISIEMYARSQRAENNWLVRTLINRMNPNVDDEDGGTITIMNDQGGETTQTQQQKQQPIGREELELAKQILREKALIGLLEEKEESMRRIELYLGLPPAQDDDANDDDDRKRTTPKQQKECRDRILHWSWPNQNAHPQVEKDSTVWDLLMKKNELDMELYEYARDVLFPEQASLFEGTDYPGSIRPKKKNKTTMNKKTVVVTNNEHLQEVAEAIKQSEVQQEVVVEKELESEAHQQVVEKVQETPVVEASPPQQQGQQGVETVEEPTTNSDDENNRM